MDHATVDYCGDFLKLKLNFFYDGRKFNISRQLRRECFKKFCEIKIQEKASKNRSRCDISTLHYELVKDILGYKSRY